MAPPFEPASGLKKQPQPMAPLALAFATIERPNVAQRLIKSARRYFPTMPIYVADQSLSVSAMESFYAQMQVSLIRMTYDSGVCASRNRLVSAIKEDFFVLCDDDFVFGSRTDFGDALRILENHPEIGVVGGKLYDYNDREEYERNWELFLQLDVENRLLVSVPISKMAPRARSIGSIRFLMCDAVMNFAVIRRSIFESGSVRWDERFKSNGEHEDFYLNMKLNSPHRVAYLPTLVAYHHHPESYIKYISELRDRMEGWRLFFDKWGIDQHLEIDLGVRTVDQLAEVIPEPDANKRFFLNNDLSLRRRSESPAILIGTGSDLSLVGAVDPAGQIGVRPRTTGTVLLQAATGKVIAESLDDAAAGSGEATAMPEETPAIRYALGVVDSATHASLEDLEILIRYDPIIRSDADFFVWYRMTRIPDFVAESHVASPGVAAVFFRWFADDGRCLLWEGARVLVDLGPRDYWVPVLVEVPVYPKGCKFLRFEVIAHDSASSRGLLASGFLFKGGRSSALQRRPIPSPARIALDALALTPWRMQEEIPPAAAKTEKTAHPRFGKAITITSCSERPEIVLITSKGLEELQYMFLAGSQRLEIPLSVLMSHEIIPAPPPPMGTAYPREMASALRVTGYSRIHGYVDVPVDLDLG